MSTLVNRFSTKEPTLCAVCHRHAVWLGYPNRPPFIWLCDDNGCHAVARKVYAMPQRTLDAYEIGAVLEAGDIAGGYLDEIGNTDLAKLDAGQWREFLRRIVVGFEQSLRRKILNDEPPFWEQSPWGICGEERPADRARLRCHSDYAGHQEARHFLQWAMARPRELAAAI